MGLLKDLSDFAASLPVNAAQRVHLEILTRQAEALVRKVKDLEAKVRELENEKSKLKDQVSRATIPAEYVEHRGALFKRSAKGGFESDPYCRDCKGIMSSLMEEMPYRCQRCNITLNFTGRDFTRVVREIG